MKQIADLSWPDIHGSLNQLGFAHLPNFLTREACEKLIGRYSDASTYRNTISMERYRFGKGEYKYYAYPLPPQITRIRTDLYSPLAQLANAWMKSLEIPITYPEDHMTYIKQCHAAGQLRPTPLILKYEAGGYNTLHQDLYGDVYFPFQVVILLTEPGRDHEGGELVLVEQLPRAQSKASVIAPRQGDAVIFPTNFRPIQGSRGWYRSRMKHGVSPVSRGKRYACGVIFHDAK
jgi:hypothetical protein